MKTATLFLIAIPLATTAAFAAEDDALAYYMTLSGSVEIGLQGEVLDVWVQDGLQEELREPVLQRLRKWTFEPVIEDGEAVVTQAVFSVLLIGRNLSDGVELTVGKPSFGERLRGVHHTPAPFYPSEPLKFKIEAIIRLQLHLDERGRVVDTHVRQTAMSPFMSTDVMKRRMLRQFEMNAVRAARKWRFDRSAMSGDTISYTLIYEIGRRPQDSSFWQVFEYSKDVPAPWLKQRGEEEWAVDGAAGQAIAQSNRIQLLDDGKSTEGDASRGTQ